MKFFKKRKRTIKPRKRTKLSYAIFIVLVFGSLSAAIFLLLHPQYTFLSPLGMAKNDKTKDVARLLEKENLQVENVVTATDSAYLVTLKNGSQVLFSSKKDLAEQTASLQLIYTRLTIEGKKFSLIDFRFDKAVVTY